MKTQRKTQTKRRIPELCAAIRTVREAQHMTQAAFAQHIQTAAISLSRWETGTFQPRDPDTLRRLHAAAAAAGLDAEAKLFEDRMGSLPDLPYVGIPTLAMNLHSIAEWRQMYACRLASSYLPEVANAVQDALKPALDLLSEIIREEAPVDGKLDTIFYDRLAPRLDELAARKVFPHKFDIEGEQQ
jgi:transcriptional regulator with XRE-family HTH domain